MSKRSLVLDPPEDVEGDVDGDNRAWLGPLVGRSNVTQAPPFFAFLPGHLHIHKRGCRLAVWFDRILYFLFDIFKNALKF